MSTFKFRQVKEQRTYRAWSEWAEGDYIICKLIDVYPDKFRNECYEVEIIECSFEDKSAEFKEGAIVGLNSMGSLHYKLEDVPLKSIARIEYTGMDTINKGPFEGKECHTCSVAVDENSLPDSKTEAQQIEEVQDKDQESKEDESEGHYDL